MNLECAHATVLNLLASSSKTKILVGDFLIARDEFDRVASVA